MLRVLHLRSSRGWAGPERHLVELGRALSGCGVEATLAALDPVAASREAPHPLVAAAREAGLSGLAFADRGLADLARDVGECFAAGGYDLIHSHDYKANWIARRVARRARMPCVATVHLHTRSSWKLRLYHRVDRVELERFDAVIAVAQALLGDIPGRLRNGDEPRVIHNGLDAEQLRRHVCPDDGLARTAFEPDEPGPRLVAIGRLAPQKGFDLLLEALAALRERKPGLRLAIIGDGPQKTRLERATARYGLARQVRFLGARADAARWMMQSDLIVLPSRREGLPYVALEAMALGRPLVASAAGGVPELLGPGDVGDTPPPGCVRRLAKAIVATLDDPERSARVAAIRQERVERCFGATRMAEETARIYREIAA